MVGNIHKVQLVNEFSVKGTPFKGVGGINQATTATSKFKSITDATNHSLAKHAGFVTTNNAALGGLTTHFEKTFKASDKTRKSISKMSNAMGEGTKKGKGFLLHMTKFRWALVNVAMAAALAYGAFNVFIKPTIELETAMVKVRKTTGMTTEEIKGLETQLLDMSKSVPQSADELAEMAAVAGQLGIQGSEN
ncbi:MAG: phage tail tape measure protein, partial [Nanoarchaeota archaeon]|nr:phage tail tape measure protein [Nanoarchaeota archaeon]